MIERKINTFEYEGVLITDPTMDETGRFKVNPVEYYGSAYTDRVVKHEYSREQLHEWGHKDLVDLVLRLNDQE
jgi:hypothetical protein